MRRLISIIILIISLNGIANAQSGICESYAILNINGAGNTFYDMQAATANPDLNGANLGNFNIGSNTLVLNGGENKIYKCGTDAITQCYLYYRIYKTTATPPAFTSSQIFFNANIAATACNCGGSDERWQSSGANINVLNGLFPGTYYLEIYTNADYTWASGSGTHYANNGTLNYKAQFTVTPVYVTSTIGTSPATYATLKTAFDAVNLGTHKGTIAVSIYGNTTEVASASLNASGSGAASYTSMSIQPAGGSAITVSGNLAGNLVNFNGASNVTVDGLNSGGNTLTFSNTNTTTASTVRYIASATNACTNDILTNCTILGSNTSQSQGTVWFLSTAVASSVPLSTVTVSNCNIGTAGVNLPVNGIYAEGTAALVNTNINIQNNNIYDFFATAANSSGIKLVTGNSGWSISNNRIYQTAARNFTSGASNPRYTGIDINQGTGGTNFSISGNIIGYANSTGTGVTNIGGVFAHEMRPIYFKGATGTASTIQNNTIDGITYVNARGGLTVANAGFVGIDVEAGTVNLYYNTIGSMTGTGSISLTSSFSVLSALAPFAAIYFNATAATNINGNNIGGISLASTTGASDVLGFNVIRVAQSASATISGNFIGGTPSASINSTTPSGIVDAIYIESGTSVNISANKIINTGSTGTSGVVDGIMIAGGSTINAYNNMVANLRNASSAFNPASGSVAGINISGGTNVNCYYNSIYLNGTSAGANFNVNGIYAVTTTTVDMRNNIVINTSTPKGTGRAVAYKRSSTTLGTYSNSSNNNLLYSGTPSATSLIFYDGTNSDQTLAAYKARVTPRDNNSITSALTFMDAVNGDLHITLADHCIVKKGTPIILNIDYDAETRDATTPDIGADEVPLNNIYTVPNGTCASTTTVTTLTCGSVTGNTWFYFINNATKKIVAAINPNGSNLGTVTITMYNLDGTFAALQSYTDHYGFDWNYLNKIWNVTSTNPVTPGIEPSIRFYYTPTEFTNFVLAAGCGNLGGSCTDQDLVLLQASGLTENCDATDNGVASNYNFYWYKDPANYFYEKMHIKDYGTDIAVPMYTNTITFYGDIASGLGAAVTSSNAEFDGRYFQATVPSFSEFRLFLPPQRILPVEWSSFTGRLVDTYSLLNWATSQERNTLRFEVQRGFDGTNFATIGSVDAAGNSNVIHQYNFRDLTPRQGRNYYRIKAIGVDGRISYSTIVLITIAGKGLTADIYPNPVQHDLNCTIISGVTGKVTLQVVTAEGKLLRSKTENIILGDNNIKWNMNELPAGTYFLRISSDGVPQQVKQFVKY